MKMQLIQIKTKNGLIEKRLSGTILIWDIVNTYTNIFVSVVYIQKCTFHSFDVRMSMY